MIRVVIERHIRNGCFSDYIELIRDAKKQASTNHQGFIAGELLQEKTEQNHAVIISSWEDYEAWDKWQGSDDRAAVLAQMRPLLENDEKITVLESCQLLM